MVIDDGFEVGVGALGADVVVVVVVVVVAVGVAVVEEDLRADPSTRGGIFGFNVCIRLNISLRLNGFEGFDDGLERDTAVAIMEES